MAWPRRIVWGLPLLALGALTACHQEADEFRNVAVWVLNTGGHVTISTGSASTRITRIRDLPDGPLNILAIAWDIYPGDRNTHVTDTELERLRNLSSLRELDLWASEVTDAGLSSIENLTALERLELNQTKITDAGLKRLERMKNLRHLGLAETNVSPAAVRSLRRRLPNCRIVFSQSKSDR